MSELELCKRVWQHIYHPKSAVPDVEIGRVLEVLVDSLVNEGWSGGLEDRPKGATPEETWGLAYVAIVGKTTSLDVAMSWSDRVPSHTDERDANGMPVPVDLDMYDRECRQAHAAMMEALTSLVERGELEAATSDEGAATLTLPKS